MRPTTVCLLSSFFLGSWLCDFFSLSFLVYFLYVVCECVPSVIFPVQQTTSGVGDRPNRHNNVRTTRDSASRDASKLMMVEFLGGCDEEI